MNITNRGFGIEIEFLGVQRSVVSAALNAAGIDCFVEGYNHYTRDYWKVVSDASIGHGNGSGEVVSPILKGEAGIAALKKVCDALATIDGLHVNRSCGLHVHLDSRDMTIGQIGNVFERYASFEDSIDNIMPRSRRGDSRWARSLSSSLPSVKRAVSGATEKRDLGNALGRYYKVNLTNIAERGSIEFRQHSGTTDFVKISKWLTFLMQFVETSIRLQDSTAGTKPVIKARKSVAYDAVRKIADENNVTVEWLRGRGFLWINRTNGERATYSYDEMEAFYFNGAFSTNHNTFSRNRIESELEGLGWLAQSETDQGVMDGITQDVQNWMNERNEELN
tara:strand:+ start:2897 stop:3904 length:1008 start_codon:yes stop_codon:yes gene_type:complete